MTMKLGQVLPDYERLGELNRWRRRRLNKIVRKQRWALRKKRFTEWFWMTERW